MAAGAAFEAVAPALAFAAGLDWQVVVKADGLAAGKGVTVCDDEATVAAALREALEEGRFGAAGSRVVVEERLIGPEASVMALCDETAVLALPAARDHKRLGDGDDGPNTGGMGAYSPVPDLDEAAVEAHPGDASTPPSWRKLARRGIPFRGVLYAGLMLTAGGPRAARVQRPPRRPGDAGRPAAAGRAARAAPGGRGGGPPGDRGGRGSAWRREPSCRRLPRRCVAVVLAAAGYPERPRRGDAITGLADARGAGGLVFAPASSGRPTASRRPAGACSRWSAGAATWPPRPMPRTTRPAT